MSKNKPNDRTGSIQSAVAKIMETQLSAQTTLKSFMCESDSCLKLHAEPPARESWYSGPGRDYLAESTEWLVAAINIFRQSNQNSKHCRCLLLSDEAKLSSQDRGLRRILGQVLNRASTLAHKLCQADESISGNDAYGHAFLATELARINIDWLEEPSATKPPAALENWLRIRARTMRRQADLLLQLSRTDEAEAKQLAKARLKPGTPSDPSQDS